MLKLRRKIGDQAGVTIVEAAVAGFILLTGVVGGIGIFDSSRRESNTGERLQVAQSKAEAELERMRDVPYAQLATNPSESWPTTAGADPADRVTGGTTPTFDVSDDADEELAFADPGKGIDPYSAPAEVLISGTIYEMEVYRFVSWRDVECQVLDLTQLNDTYDDLLDQLNAQLAAIDGSGGVVGQLLGFTITRLPSAVRTRVNALRGEITALKTQVLAIINALEELDEVDPCDADLAPLNELEDALAAIAPTLDAVDTALDNYKAACFNLLGIPITCPSIGSTIGSTLSSQIQALQNADYDTIFDGLVDSIGEISSADHPYNTKRVTVAVYLTPKNGSGPFKPVWATSIVSDPEAGVLAG